MNTTTRLVRISDGPATLEGTLVVPPQAKGLVLFAHGSGSSRHSPRNLFVAGRLQQQGLATLLLDLLTPAEDELYENRFDIARLTQRLLAATAWVQSQEETQQLPLGYFGASTGAAVALEAAAALGPAVAAVVSRGGRPDLAGAALPQVRTPVLLIVGGNDFGVIELNQAALARLPGPKELAVVPGASHLFAEAGTLEEVARLAGAWFTRHLGRT